MPKRERYRVKELAVMAGVSVRTLHHYDAIGLLKPSTRSASGTRVYDDGDLLRLQHILLQRELGFSLSQIKEALDAPDFDPRQALLEQREKLRQHAARTQRMLSAVEHALSLLGPALKGETSMTRHEPNPPKRRLGAPSPLSRRDAEKLFDGFDPAQYEEETEQRWGHTDAYAISAQRTASYNQQDFARLGEAQREIYRAIVQLRQAGASATDLAAMELAERHRLFIDEWFYPCNKQQHAGLADLYENDPRFAANIDKYGEGLTAFLSAAIRANAAR